ncbi:MAG: hypothetical protein EA398_11105 [Deltaproteobacteria bacterium]|nr:MAG: hypothetical protein EA398_11105 [Deltaproteobacteria bacterium]
MWGVVMKGGTWGAVLLLGLAGWMIGCGDDGASGETGERPGREVRPPAGGGGAGPTGADVGGSEEDPGERETTGEPPLVTDRICAPGSSRCVDGDTVELCDADGEAWREEPCGDGRACIADQCRVSEACTPGEQRCATPAREEVCDDSGAGWVGETCVLGEVCFDGACRAAACVPGGTVCDGDRVVQCTADGALGDTVRTCAAGRCAQGACQTGCVVDDKGVVGCEFFAVKLDHMGEGVAQPIAVTVSNVSADPVEVTVTEGNGAPVTTRTVAAGGLETIELPRRDVPFSSRTMNSFRVEADGPITAHQFAPIDRGGFASTDASLLLPSTSFGTDYLVVGWPSLQASRWAGRSFEGRPQQGRAYVTVVAAEDDTVIRFTPATATEAGQGVPAVAAGSTFETTLARGEVVSFATPAATGLDLTGSRVTSSAPVGVFFGHMCAEVPVGNCCCDHIEQQLVPVDTWGTEVIATKFSPRGTEVDYWRFIAAEDGTMVELTPPVEGIDVFTLNRGEVRELRSSTSFLARATGPILAGQFMAAATAPGVPSSGCSGSGGYGDPAMTLNVGSEQYVDEYIVLIPPTGFRDHWLSFVVRSGASVQLNGSPLSGTGLPIAGTPWVVHHVRVQPGVQRAEGSEPFGLYAYGYDCAVSYAYPGGMNLDDR